MICKNKIAIVYSNVYIAIFIFGMSTLIDPTTSIVNIIFFNVPLIIPVISFMRNKIKYSFIRCFLRFNKIYEYQN